MCYNCQFGHSEYALYKDINDADLGCGVGTLCIPWNS